MIGRFIIIATKVLCKVIGREPCFVIIIAVIYVLLLLLSHLRFPRTNDLNCVYIYQVIARVLSPISPPNDVSM